MKPVLYCTPIAHHHLACALAGGWTAALIVLTVAFYVLVSIAVITVLEIRDKVSSK